MKGEIRRLSDSLIDQIAAGEVVERPASVVKELVENSLDAGATRIRVDVRDGGKALIAVTDDGYGMPSGALRLALERHATSKLADASELERVMSFGFRGEALPAIASVSRMRLFSRARGSDTGHEIRLDTGKLEDSRSAGGPEGTRIEVAKLFGRVPARRKFLKKSSTEWGHIADWMGRLALALPGVHFELRRDERPPIVWPAVSDTLDRIAAVLGEAEADALQRAECDEAGGHIEAYVSGPEATRTNANALYLYVNGRPVRDKVMRHALLQAYRDVLPRGRFPSAVVFLTLAPGRVDVNVHPAKWEVRFEDPQSIHRLLRRAVREAMAGRGWLGSGVEEAAAGSSPGASRGLDREGRAERPAPGGADADRVREVGASDWVLAQRGTPGQSTFEESSSLPGLSMAGAVALVGSDGVAGGERAHEGQALRFSEMRLIGQLLAAYLIVEAKDGLLLVDQHAAHERVLYEGLRREWLDRGVERQGLLLPITLEIDPLEAAALEENAELVGRLGFELEPFGEGAVVVRALPALLSGRDPSSLVRSLAAELESSEARSDLRSGEETRLLAAADRVFASLACHSARRAGDHLEPREQQQILHDLDQIPWAPTCPHGRPVAVAYAAGEIERRFGRR
jgi:DNA mismatch repair protein MutL